MWNTYHMVPFALGRMNARRAGMVRLAHHARVGEGHHEREGLLYAQPPRRPRLLRRSCVASRKDSTKGGGFFAALRMTRGRAAGLLARTVAGGLLLLAIGCGGAPEEPATPLATAEPTPAATATRSPIPPRSAALGETLENSDWRITLDKVETVALAEMDDPTAPSGPGAPADILVAQLTMYNLSEDDSGINLNDFQLVTAEPDYLPALNCCQLYSMRSNTLWIDYGTNFGPGGSNTFLLFFGLAPDAKPALFQFLKGGLQWEFAGG